MKKILPLLAMVFFGVFPMVDAQAQARTVTGKVTSMEDGSTLPGVNVVVKGTSTGTSTDANGNFSISVPSNESVLVFSFIGLVTEEVTVGTRTVIDVQMSSDLTQLTEIVIVGYGEQDKRTLTSTISTVKGAEIANLNTPDFASQLGGRSPGLQVTTTNGIIGEAPRIRIRGSNSISSGTSPLIVIDNVPMITGNQSSVTPTNPLADINPADIESIEILRDGAATAIYGSRATNGVILITTKRGQAGATRVKYDSYYGFNQAVNKFDLLNSAEFVEVNNEKYTNAGLDPQAVLEPNGFDTDWQDIILQRGFVQNHALSITGGTEKTTFLISLGYLDQEGHVVANNFKRYSYRSNLDHSPMKWLKIGSSLSLTGSQTTGLNTGANALGGNLLAASRAFPNVSPYDANNPTGFNLTPDAAGLGQGPNLSAIENNYFNVAFLLANNQRTARTYRVLANTYAQAEILPGLKFRTQIAIDLLNNRDFSSADPRHGDGRGSNGSVAHQNREVYRWNWQNYFDYRTSFAQDHNINIVAGLEYQKTTTSSFRGSGSDFSSRFFIQDNLITGSFSNQFSGGTFGLNGFESIFGRANYDYRGKYLLSMSFRRDGISDLAPENRFGFFPGGSVGWRVSEEDFFQGFDFIDELKLRASYAVVGNTFIGSFPYLGLFGSGQYASQNGIEFAQVGNTDLKWESSAKSNIGADFGFLKNRLNVSLDYFVTRVDNMILFAPTPPSLGIPGNGINQNIGEMENKGIELLINAEVMNRNGFVWNTSFNYTNIKNQIISLSNNNADVPYDYHLLTVGKPIGTLWGFKYMGVNSANGNPIYEKADGSLVQGNISNTTYYVYDPSNPTDLTTQSNLTNNDKRTFGQGDPRWLGGWINNFRYKNFDLEIFIRYSGGNQLLNLTRSSQMDMGFVNNNRELINRWTTPGQVTDVPKVHYANGNFINVANQLNSRFLEKGDFVRIQNIILGYNVPQSALNSFANGTLRSVRLYVQLQNYFTFTSYSGLDPELTGTGNIDIGLDNNANPLVKSTSFGINIGL
jgi:TonB-dependent starch-binding outer membrane protein SusC